MNKCLIAFLLFIATAHTRANGQNIAGIGAQLILDTTGGHSMPRIFRLVQGSPAYDSLRATDYIIKVDDVSCRDKTIETIVGLIRGEAGTMVKITTANTMEGEAPKDHELKRVGMNIPAPPDPKEAFFAACNNEVKQMRKTGAVIVKTFNSDCGSYFFNFNANSGPYHIRLIAQPDANDKSGKGFTASAKAFDNDHEADATNLGALDSKNATNGTARLEGTISFTHDCVCTIAINLHDDDKKCRAMYVVVYR